MSEPSLAERAALRAVDARVRTSEQDVRRLLDAGLALMTAGGADKQPRITDIIRAAGLSNQAFYRYFASKDDLVAAVIDDGERRLISYVQRQLAAASVEDSLRVFVEAVTSQAADPAVADATRAVMWNATRTFDARGARTRQLQDRLSALLVEPMQALASRDPERDAAVVAGAVISFMIDNLWRQTVPTVEDIEHLLAFCLAGVKGS